MYQQVIIILTSHGQLMASESASACFVVVTTLTFTYSKVCKLRLRQTLSSNFTSNQSSNNDILTSVHKLGYMFLFLSLSHTQRLGLSYSQTPFFVNLK